MDLAARSAICGYMEFAFHNGAYAAFDTPPETRKNTDIGNRPRLNGSGGNNTKNSRCALCPLPSTSRKSRRTSSRKSCCSQSPFLPPAYSSPAILTAAPPTAHATSATPTSTPRPGDDKRVSLHRPLHRRRSVSRRPDFLAGCASQNQQSRPLPRRPPAKRLAIAPRPAALPLVAEFKIYERYTERPAFADIEEVPPQIPLSTHA